MIAQAAKSVPESDPLAAVRDEDFANFLAQSLPRPVQNPLVPEWPRDTMQCPRRLLFVAQPRTFAASISGNIPGSPSRSFIW